MAGERIVNYFDKIEKKTSGPQPSRALLEEEVTSELDSPGSQLAGNGMLTALDMARKVQLLSFDDVSPSNASIAGSSLNRDLVLARLNKSKVLSLIKAWEEGMKKKSENSYNKKVAKISAWEVAKKARAEATLRSSEEKIEKEKAAFIERTKNKVALVQRVADEQRALAEAHHGQELLKAEEIAAKCRASGTRPGKFVVWS
ncbi:hypothetical protein L7F22_009960 [Adiantum nelumboides]|nr:hypothetical protein [Adiantum nelumboides]